MGVPPSIREENVYQKQGGSLAATESGEIHGDKHWQRLVKTIFWELEQYSSLTGKSQCGYIIDSACVGQQISHM